ncbi:uncharacterized protein LAJ45_09888 [Morchella importuna]|uniref:uncharacterized protein n=1 Tax=Morchella importuna TaxID=1174673 RepID=UPI001E8D2B1B|nr:uncharacterized protein LAJ45_09888 [Morchella importuna]KAH8146190.1 hypothetical protein LAJ45_09888 [Morchella importuna]
MGGRDNRSVYVKTKKTRGGSRVQKLRRSQRNIIVRIKREELSNQEQPTQEPTPPCSPRPGCVRRSSAPPNKNITTAINQRSDKLESKYTGSVPLQSQGPGITNQCQEPREFGPVEIESQAPQQPTVNWDCVSYVVSDQKVQTSYEKPEMSPIEVDSDGNPIPSSTRVQAYGKMVTKTVTMTVTTTIATTEILRPGEEGYEESVERQKRQREQGPEEKQKQERQYHESRKWANGDRTMHENFHFTHHRAAQPAPSTTV